MKYILLNTIIFCGFCFLGKAQINTTKGTTALVYITNDTIWIAADSKRIVSVEGRKVSELYRNKINQTKDIFFIITGDVVTLQKPPLPISFDAVSSAKKGIRHGGKFSTIFTASQDSIKADLNFVYKNKMSIAEQQYYNKMANQVFLEIIMVSNKNGVLDFSGSQLTIKNTNGKYQFMWVDKEMMKKYQVGGTMFPAGHTEMIKPILKSGELTGNSVKKMLSNLIQLEIDAPENRGEVGGTIDVIAIYPKGFKWQTNNRY